MEGRAREAGTRERVVALSDKAVAGGREVEESGVEENGGGVRVGRYLPRVGTARIKDRPS